MQDRLRERLEAEKRNELTGQSKPLEAQKRNEINQGSSTGGYLILTALTALVGFVLFGTYKCFRPLSEGEKRANACQAAVEVMDSRHTNSVDKLKASLYYDQYCKDR